MTQKAESPSGCEIDQEEPEGLREKVRDWFTGRQDSELVAAWFGCSATDDEVTSAFHKACVRSCAGLAVGVLPTLSHLTAGNVTTALVGGGLTAAFLYVSERRRRMLGHAVAFINAEERLERAQGAEMFIPRGEKVSARARKNTIKAGARLELLAAGVGYPTLLDRVLCVTPPSRLPLGSSARVSLTRRFLL